jgi:hypothetical protein
MCIKIMPAYGAINWHGVSPFRDGMGSVCICNRLPLDSMPVGTCNGDYLSFVYCSGGIPLVRVPLPRGAFFAPDMD